MANEIRVTNADAPAPPPGRVEPASTESLGALFKELAHESSTLLKQEIALAKLEMRENVRSLAKDMVKMAIGGGLLLVGLLALVAALIAGLGDIFGDEYWLGALIVGGLFALIGIILAMSGKSGLQRDDLKPERTIQTLKEDKQWAQAEAKQVKRDLTS